MMSTDLPTPTAVTKKSTRKIQNIILAGIAGIILIIIISIIVFLCHLKHDTTLPPEYYSQNETENIIVREKWLSRRINENIPKLKHPSKYVLICHTVGRFCESFDNCSYVLRWMQNRSINKLNLFDLPYNFLIGGDGNVYEGRGWNFQHQLAMKEESLAIAFIGNYVYYDSLTEIMVNKTQDFLNFAVEKGFLMDDYLLVPQNHTVKTMSPGGNIYKEIKNWEHFSSEIIF